MPGSNIIHLDAYRPPERLVPDEELSSNPLMPAAALTTMGLALWSNAFLFPVYASLAVLDAWSKALDD